MIDEQLADTEGGMIWGVVLAVALYDGFSGIPTNILRPEGGW